MICAFREVRGIRYQLIPVYELMDLFVFGCLCVCKKKKIFVDILIAGYLFPILFLFLLQNLLLLFFYYFFFCLNFFMPILSVSFVNKRFFVWRCCSQAFSPRTRFRPPQACIFFAINSPYFFFHCRVLNSTWFMRDNFRLVYLQLIS